MSQQYIMTLKACHGQISLANTDMPHPSITWDWPHQTHIPGQDSQITYLFFIWNSFLSCPMFLLIYSIKLPITRPSKTFHWGLKNSWSVAKKPPYMLNLLCEQSIHLFILTGKPLRWVPCSPCNFSPLMSSTWSWYWWLTLLWRSCFSLFLKFFPFALFTQLP